MIPVIISGNTDHEKCMCRPLNDWLPHFLKPYTMKMEITAIHKPAVSFPGKELRSFGMTCANTLLRNIVTRKPVIVKNIAPTGFVIQLYLTIGSLYSIFALYSLYFISFV